MESQRRSAQGARAPRGSGGELVLRRSGGDLEVIADGTSLISSANAASSRALVTAGLPRVAGERLQVLIGASAWATARAPGFFLLNGFRQAEEGPEAAYLIGDRPLCPQYGRECTPQPMVKAID